MQAALGCEQYQRDILKTTETAKNTNDKEHSGIK